MKAILIILIVGIGGYAAWLKHENGTVTVAKVLAESKLAAAERKVESLEKDLKKVASDLEAERLKVKALATASPAAGAAEAGAPVAEVVPMTTVAPAPVAAPAVDPQAAAAEAKRAKRLAQIDLELAALRAEQSRGQSARATAAANPPTFSEQGDRVNGFGQVIGKKGVRTSDADRAKVMADYQARIGAMDARLAEIERQIAALEAERSGL